LLSGRAVAVIVFVWAGAMELVEALRLAAAENEVLRPVLIALVDVLLRWRIARYALHARSSLSASARIAGGGFALGVAQAAAALAPLARHAFASAPIGRALGVHLALAPLAAAGYAAVLAALVRPHVAADSAESSEAAIVVGASWVAFPQLVTAVFGFRVALPEFPVEPSWLVATGLGVALPFVVALAATVRIACRRDWLERASAGSFPGWRVVDRAEAASGDGLPRLAPGDENVLLKVVVPDSPFRAAECVPAATFRKPPPIRWRVARGVARLLLTMLAMAAATAVLVGASAAIAPRFGRDRLRDDTGRNTSRADAGPRPRPLRSLARRALPGGGTLPP
jgi:hypothetical protein